MSSNLKKLSNNLTKKTKNLINKIESSLNAKAKIAIGGLIALTIGYSAYSLLSGGPADPTANSVMITNLAQNSGGSGVILSSNETESLILTNKHVCKVVERGGLVSGVAGTFMVTYYAASVDHDLCAIVVSGNLKASTKIASKSPKAFYEEALISGHPQLLPNVVTKGHYSGRKLITLVTGIQSCKPEEFRENPYCAFFGVKPILEEMESTLVTATIMAGSSGSGVYNSKGELTNLVFAGSGDLSYAFVVPFEYVLNFKRQIENGMVYWKNPVQNPILTGEEAGFESKSYLSRMKERCSKTSDEAHPQVKKMCSLIRQSTIWNK